MVSIPRKVIVELSVVPLGTSKTGVSEYVACAVQSIKDSGLKYQLHPAGTVFEAPDLETAFKVSKAAHQAVLDAGAKRVLTAIRLDDRVDAPKGLEEMVESVKSKLK